MTKGALHTRCRASDAVVRKVSTASKGEIGARLAASVVSSIAPDTSRKAVEHRLSRVDAEVWDNIDDSMKFPMCVGKRPFELEFANPAKLIQYLIDSSDWLTDLFAHVLARHPCAPSVRGSFGRIRQQLYVCEVRHAACMINK